MIAPKPDAFSNAAVAAVPVVGGDRMADAL
jgi:hypothetical protein